MPEALEASVGVGVIHLFCTVGEGTDRAAIEAAVKATGYTSASKAFSKVLGHTITLMKKELRRAGRGVYGLA